MTDSPTAEPLCREFQVQTFGDSGTPNCAISSEDTRAFVRVSFHCSHPTLYVVVMRWKGMNFLAL